MTEKRNSAAGTGLGLERGDQRRLESKIAAARRALTFEKIWPRFWLCLAIAGLFVMVSTLQLWSKVSPQTHLILLYGFGAALALATVRLLFFKRPTRDEALARLEKASALEHRPLTALHDRLSNPGTSPAADALWNAHQERMAGLLRRVKSGTPHPRIDKSDPLALRAGLLLVLAVVSFWSWPDLPGRVQAAFVIPETPVSGDFRLDIWVTPPSYTRKEPVVLANGLLKKSKAETTVKVPQGSVLTLKINGEDAANYSVSLNQNGSLRALSNATPSAETYAEYTDKLNDSAILTVKRSYGSALTWKIETVPDRAPVIAFSGAIEVANRGALLFKYKAEDDYGVVSAEAILERGSTSAETADKAPTLPRIGKPPVFPLSLPRSPIKMAEGKTYKDLTSHPWAGLPVVITLSAKDETGTIGRSAPRGIILPERKFTKPLARAVIGQRRELVENPSATSVVAQSLNALIIASQDDNLRPPIYLGLRSAYWRLRKNPQIDEVESIVDQLWEIAVKIEDGNLSEAERALRAAQERLKEALERGAPPEEIQKRVAELREALNRFLQALASQPSDPRDRAAASKDAKNVTAQDLQKLLNRIENLAKSGSNNAAEQMLSELQDILEGLQAAKQAGKNGGQSGEGQQEDSESLQQLDRLTNLMRQQQQLLDQTFRAQKGEQEGGQSEGKPGLRGQSQSGRGEGGGGSRGETQSAEQLRQKQEGIRQGLEELLGGMSAGGAQDQIRQKLQEAERAMKEAGESLDAGELPQASEDEGRALDRLRQGTRAMAEQMMRAQGGSGPGSQSNRDPLGRRPNGQINDPGDNVKVPDEITVQRAREILEELRKRLGEPTRPPGELDYLERLIKQF